MDDIKNLWNELQSPDAVSMDSDQLIAAIKSESKGEIEKLNTTLKHKNMYIWAFILLFAAFMFKAPNMVVMTLLGILMVMYVIAGILLVKERQLLKQGVDLTDNLYGTLQSYYDRISKVLKYEEITALMLYPISISAGFVSGLGVYGDVMNFFSGWKGWATLAVLILVLTPLTHRLAKWMNKKAFDQYLNALKANIEQLRHLKD